LIGVVVSLVILAIVAKQFGYNFETVFEIKPAYLALAMATSVGVLLIQGLRFRYVVTSFAGVNHLPLTESLTVRIGSQFVAMTTPAYFGGEFARAAWLTKKGVSGGTALWLPYIEIIFDVFGTGIVAFIGGLVALSYGHPFLGGILVLMSTIMLSLMVFVINFSRSSRFHFPAFIIRFTHRVAGQRRGSWLEGWGTKLFEELRAASSNTLNSAHKRGILWTSMYTLLIIILTGACLVFTAQGLGIHLNFYEATLAVFASIMLGNLPITFGGSGLAEIGVYYYTSLVFGISSWPMVFAWRVSSYIMPLIVTWGAATVSLHRYAR
jgi:uncharacterized protein (TIRG00374 family)